MESKTTEMFETMSVPKAVMKLAIPSMLGTLMNMVYNLADTVFIGLIHNDYQLAAVSLAMPVFMILMAVGSVFGIGGASVISRALGENRRDYASKVCSFCTWSSVFIGVFSAIISIVGMEGILKLLSTTDNTREYVKTYLTIVFLGAPFVLISNCQSSILRAQGESSKAVVGMILGNLINIILDPIMILTLGWGIAGAAWATLLGNVVSALYYILYYARGNSTLSVRLKDYALGDKVLSGVLSIGLPSSLSMLLMSISQMMTNTRMAEYGDLAVASLGIGSKVVMISTMLCMGIGMGAQPLLGYTVGAKNWKRFKSTLRFTCIFAFAVGAGMTILSYLFLPQIVNLFLTEPEAYEYGLEFARILLTTGFLFGIYNVFSSSLQSMGAAVSAMIVNISRQGLIFIPMLLLLSSQWGMNGIVWTQPITDALSLLLAVVCFLIAYKRLSSCESHTAAPETA